VGGGSASGHVHKAQGVREEGHVHKAQGVREEGHVHKAQGIREEGHVHKAHGGGGAAAEVAAGNVGVRGTEAAGGSGSLSSISGAGSFETLDSWLRVVKEEASASASINVVAPAVNGGTPPKMGWGGGVKAGPDGRPRPGVKFSSPTSIQKEHSGGAGDGEGSAAHVSMLKGLLKRSCQEISRLKAEVKEAIRASTEREGELGLANAALGEKNQLLM
jgi:hypothetical protein